MDNLTHSLVGLAASKAGLERLSPAATTVCIIAANAPDVDILSTFGGRWAYLQNHRGITHSIIGTFALAILIPLIVWLGDYLIARIARRPSKVKFRGLLLASLIVSATHPILDWTNNYGIRLFLPWSSRWYYGDLVFIVDPWLWLSLGGACFLITAKTKWRIGAWSILGTVLTFAVVLVPMLRPGSIFPVGARVVWALGIVTIFLAHRARLADRWQRLIPLTVFALIVVYWGGLAILHRRVLAQAETVATVQASSHGETIHRLAAMPVLANPLRWQCVFETDRATYRFDYSLSQEKAVSEIVRYEKPQGQAYEAYAIAARDEHAKIFLGFARFPVIHVEGDCVSETLVQFADLRYTEPGSGRRGTFSLEVPIECPRPSGELEKK
jgi:inner membrane protein